MTTHTASDQGEQAGLSPSVIEDATDEVFARCEGDHTRDCAWHAVMGTAENAAESGDTDCELIENALALIDDGCQCAVTR